MRGFRGGHSPPFSPRIDTLFLPEPREKEPVLFVFVAFIAVEPPALSSSSRPQPWSAAPPRRSPRRGEPGWAARSVRAISRHLAITGCCPRHPSCWGFGLPESSFFSEWLHFFGLQPHHLAPNAILERSAFMVLCDGFLGIEPRLDLWRSMFFFKKQSIAMEKAELEKLAGPRPMTPCGATLVHHRSTSGFPQLPLQESIEQWQKGFFYVKNADPAQDALNMPPFNINPPTKLNWAAKSPKPIPEVAQIGAHLEILEKGGLLGRDLLTTMVTRRILSLQRRLHLVCHMGG
ncbi:hypothetical protein D1007_36446 [Hordeum vulgare]|nr:hypothetical protein D1007_36446 [Hordeum vulgare]